MAGSHTAWVLPASPTCLPNGRGNARCSAFHPTDPAFEPCLHQRRSPPPGNAILQGRDKGPERPLEIQSTDCGDKIHARIAASSGLRWPREVQEIGFDKGMIPYIPVGRD